MIPHFARALSAVAVAAAVALSLVRYLLGQPSPLAMIQVGMLILIWVPLKGALLKFLGGRRPYRSALLANAASEIMGLGFPLSSLGLPWPALAASLGLSTLVEGLVLVAMATAGAGACLGMAFYMNVLAHLIVAGLILWPLQPVGAAAAIGVSLFLFVLPIFLVRRAPLPEVIMAEDERGKSR